MKYTKEEVQRLEMDLSGFTETLDDSSVGHKILGECRAMCRRWNSLLDKVEELEKKKSE